LLAENFERSGRPGALGILEGLLPAGKGEGIGLTGAEGALTTMDARGTAVGFVDTKEKVGVGPVGVGNRVPVMVAPETLEPAGAEAPEEAAEAAEAAAGAAGVAAAEEAAPLDEAMS
jgi:hypothetical protein